MKNETAGIARDGALCFIGLIAVISSITVFSLGGELRFVTYGADYTTDVQNALTLLCSIARRGFGLLLLVIGLTQLCIGITGVVKWVSKEDAKILPKAKVGTPQKPEEPLGTNPLVMESSPSSGGDANKTEQGQTPSALNENLVDQLKQIKDLLDQGILTQEEYDLQKASILQ